MCPTELNSSGSAETPNGSAELSAAAHDNAERLRAIFDTAVEGIITISSAGLIETFNNAAEKLFRYPRAEVIGKNVNLLMPAPYKQEHDSYLLNYLRSGHAKIIGIGREVIGRRKDGSVFPMKLAVSEVKLADRTLFTGFIHDLTERDQAEDALKRLNAELEQRVTERTQELEDRAAQLNSLAIELTKAEGRERLRLAQILHDDLQQTLVAAKFGVGGLIGRAPSEEVRAALRSVEELIQQSITTSRNLTSELSSPAALRVGLPDAIQWLARSMKDKHGLDVRVEAHPAADCVGEDLRELTFSVLRELLFNVVKHAGTNLAEITMDTPGDGSLTIMVMDLGKGFNPAESRAAENAGAGFGLSSIRNRLTAAGGSFHLESSPGLGTRITIKLPCPTGENAAEPAASRYTRD